MEDWRNEHWETLCPKADIEVGKIFERLYNDEISLKKSFEQLENIPYNFEDAEIAKETSNKFIDHIVLHLGLEEDVVVDMYQKVCHENYNKFLEENPEIEDEL